MLKRFFAIFLLTALVLSAQNLVPPVGDGWEIGRNADGISDFGVEDVDGVPTFHIKMKTAEGYTLYRCYPRLEPGDYTFRARVSGNTPHGIFFEAYSFDKDGKPAMILNERTPAGVMDPTLYQVNFKVPVNSAYIRIGVGNSSGGECYWSQPELLAGKQPLPKESTALVLEPIQSQWLADWIFLKNDPGEPRVDLYKDFELDSEAVSAFFQLTGDNGYEFVVNGKSVGSDTEWRTVELYDIAKYLKHGTNRVEVHVMNYDESGALLLQGRVVTASGAKVDIKTDETWGIRLPHGGPAELLVIGKVPCSPWGAVDFHKVIPPKVYDLQVLEATTEVTAGETIKFVMGLNPTLKAKKELSLSFRFTDENGRETPLSGFDPIVRMVPERNSLYLELLTSPYAMPGTYKAEVLGDGFIIPCRNVTVKAAEIPASCIGTPFPKPAMTNTVTTANYTQSLFNYSPITMKEEYWRNFSETKGHFYEVFVLSGDWMPENIFNTVNCEKQLLSILEHDPDASVVLKVRIDVPGWWVAAHPAEVFRSNKGRAGLQSFCSEKWREDALAAIGNTLDFLATRPSGKAVVGVLIMGFKGGEFQLWGEAEGEYDCSDLAKNAFAKYLQDHDIQMWISLPHPALGFPQPAEMSASDAAVCDLYYRFVAERHAENMSYFVREFKKRFGERYSFGMYFGYGMEYAGSHSRMLLAGHLGLEKLLGEAAPDIESCPISYALRGADRSHAFMYPVDSARLHGAMPMGENDVRNYRNPELADSAGATILSFADSVTDNTRIRVFEACHGAMVRYLGLHPLVDWYFDPAMVRTIAADNKLVQTLEPNPIGGDEQVVLAVNYLEWTKAWRVPEKTIHVFGSRSRDTLMRTGRAVSFVTFADYLANLKLWKNAVIPLPGMLTDAQKAALAEAFGALPKIKVDDGALLLKDGQWSVLAVDATDEDLWSAFATPEARAAGMGTVWYQGGNFTYTWDGKSLKRLR
ncbi:MAG: hypothetical protein MJ202_09720 [Lentisphaeria bacterium]|nr:hypothetical protein [Lentisphaeria bacterium]